MIVYKITNLLNGKIYVGQTTQTLEARMLQHKYHHKGLYIDRAIYKYGFENFHSEILEECNTQDELNEREKFWIAKLNSKVPFGYNQTDGGRGHSGYIPTLEALANMSKAAKIRESKRKPDEKSMIAKKGWAKKTPEERSELAKKREANKTPEERTQAANKAAAKRKLSMTLEERKKMTENARLALKLRTHEQRSESAKKAWQTIRANKAKKQQLIKNLIDLIKKLGERF